jgi:DHA2 family multidrug resistance protein-like MFS transporter
MAITTFGVGGPFALVTDLVVGSVRPEKAGSASAISETSGESGIALGIATLGSLGTIIYRNQMTDTIPAGVPAGSAETARESITGGVSVAGQLPAPLSAELLDGAREAFTIGMTTVAGVGAAAAAVCVLLAVILLRNMRPSGDVQTDDAGSVPAAAAGYSFNESPMTASD